MFYLSLRNWQGGNHTVIYCAYVNPGSIYEIIEITWQLYPAAHNAVRVTEVQLYPAAHNAVRVTEVQLYPAAHNAVRVTEVQLYPVAHNAVRVTEVQLYPVDHNAVRVAKVYWTTNKMTNNKVLAGYEITL